MTNFKSGSGDLDFGESAENSEEHEKSTNTGPNESTGETGEDRTDTAGVATNKPSANDADRSSPSVYPYFVRRNNVGDERDTRLEIHVRDKVAEQEAAFRNELAEQLGTNDVSKTDAREFALLAAYHNPEHVAELMKQEGFGALD